LRDAHRRIYISEGGEIIWGEKMNRKLDLIQRIGYINVLFGWFWSFTLFIDGYTVPAIILFIIGVVGLYLMYYPYPRMKNIVAVPERFKDVYYDEKGLYYDIPGKPYLFKWDEVKEYSILSVEEVDEYPKRLIDLVLPIPHLMLSLARYIAWRNIDQEYASTGIAKLGTVQFVKKDGSVIVLNNVLNPYRLTPIFDKYIKESNQKKDYHM
jgi:hypothetical protein